MTYKEAEDFARELRKNLRKWKKYEELIEDFLEKHDGSNEEDEIGSLPGTPPPPPPHP